MEKRNLGNSGLAVSQICLGTMTWGEQNTEQEAHRQMDYALSRGINMLDVAEMYPVPPKQATQGATETIVGNWLARHGQRDRWLIATKVAGPADWLPWLRQGPRLNRDHIQAAVDASLKRLQTDYIDLYQVHWPSRKTNFFGELGYVHEESKEADTIASTLEALEDQVAQGKIRTIGVSNETAWGVMQYLGAASNRPSGRIVSIQNPYNLLNRSFEVGLAEIAHREAVGLLAYSPLAFGVLSGKYLSGKQPPGARLTLFDRFSRYSNPQGESATQAYVSLAREHGLDPAQMALAYVNSRPFVTANIIGATSEEQLVANIDSVGLTLDDALLEQIEQIHRKYTYPCP